MASQTNQQLPLDPTYYNLSDDDLAFFRTHTGLDDTELRKHILQVQAEAYEIYPYSCIHRLAFTTVKISKFPIYDEVLKIGKERPDAMLLDLGCCFGNDVRKVISDGYRRENVIASDLHPEFWSLGHKLFKSTQETFPVAFIPGDIFDPSFLSPTPSSAPRSSTPPASAPPLSTLVSLTPLQHRISLIHTSSFFHLFSLDQQRSLAHLLSTLLSPLPGSMIFGSHRGVPDIEENNNEGVTFNWRGIALSTHSPTSWEKMWVGRGGVFNPGDVILRTRAVEVERRDTDYTGGGPTLKPHLLVWSVTRT